jgi:hypothetical protein
MMSMQNRIRNCISIILSVFSIVLFFTIGTKLRQKKSARIELGQEMKITRI